MSEGRWRTVDPESGYPRNRGRVLARVVGGVLTTEFDMVADFSAIPRRTGHMEEAWERWLPVWYRQNRQMFKAEGPGWAPLSGDPGSLNPGGHYGPDKHREFPGKTILRREDFLYRSLTHRGSRYSVLHIGPRTLRLGTSVFYSPILEEGTRYMPPRPHVLVTAASFEELNRIAMAHILNQPELRGGRRR